MNKALSNIKNSVWLFFFTQAVVPFDTVIGFYCMYGGVAGLLKLGLASNEFAQALGNILATLLNTWYIVAGASLYFGTGLRRRDIQAFGLVSIATALLVRVIAVSSIQGINANIFNLYVINISFVIACLVRLHMLFKYSYTLKLISHTTPPTTQEQTNNG